MNAGLKRVLGPIDAGWLVAGNMIGGGIFFAPGQVAHLLPGLAWPLVAWGLGGLLALCGAAVYGELGARLPRTGGDYQYLTTAYGPLWGFMTGWAAILLTFSAAAAVLSIVAVDHLLTVIPLPAALRPVASWVGGPAIILTLTLASVLGTRTAGRTTIGLTAIPLGGLAAMFVWGLATGVDVDVSVASSRTIGVEPSLARALLPIFFTYSGWNAAAYMAGEIRDPSRNLARGLLGGTLAVTVIYILINLILLLVVPAQQLDGSTTAAAHAARIMLGPWAEKALALVIAAAVIGSANVTLMAGARIYFAMARDGLAPRALGTVSARGVPAVALWVAGGWTAVLSLVRAVEVLVNWATLAMLLLSSLAVTTVFVLRRRDVGGPGYRCVGYPFTPALYLLASVAVMIFCARAFPLQSLYGLLIVATGLPAYALTRRKRGHSAF